MKKNQENGSNQTLMGQSGTYVESSALERLKNIQNLIRRNWLGVQTDYSGRPGTASIVNRKRYNPVSENHLVNVFQQLVQEDEERFKLINRMVQRLKDIEDDKQLQKYVTGSSFYSQEQIEKKQGSAITDFLIFKPIKENQILHNAPPTIAYAKSYNIESNDLLYKIFRGETKLVRSVLEANGFTYTESHEWNILWSNGNCKSYLYEGLNEYQKINHFPNSNEITRKDKLCQNLVKMQEKYGKHHFDFIPETYVLPDEFGDFYSHFQKLKAADKSKNIWIVKPANLSRGRGIYLVDDITEVNVDDVSVISKYITNPLLINGHKFDLRIYVCVTSFDPLRVYVYKEGLARFASEEYSNKITKNNKYQHLTNYSINKKNENYVQNECLENDDYGFKWSLSAFCKHLETIGIDMNLFWSRIYDVIIKSIISGENHIFNQIKKTCVHKTNCFELFGYDILIDSELKPWLIEVNLSPSLACESPLDIQIKTNLMAELLTLVGVKKYDRKKESVNKAKNRMKSYLNRGKSANSRYQNIFNPLQERSGGVFSMNSSYYNGGNENFSQTNNELQLLLDKLSESDVDILENKDLLKKLASLKYKDVLRETLSEYARKGNFVRIFPAKGSDYYDQYFQHLRPLNKFLYKVLYTDDLIPNKLREGPKINYKVGVPQKYELYKTNQKSATVLESQVSKKVSDVELMKVKSEKEIEKEVEVKEEKPSVAKELSSDLKDKSRKSLFERQENEGKQTVPIRSRAELNVQQKEVSNKSALHDKVLITGDDILIEYVERLMNALKQIQDYKMKPHWRNMLEKFISHSVWSNLEQRSQSTDSVLKLQSHSYAKQLETRVGEMKQRRKRLVKHQYKKDGRLQDFERGYFQLMNKKTQIIRKFSTIQLENFLKTSTKNLAQEIVFTLIPSVKYAGILLEMDQIFNLTLKANKEEKKAEQITENSMANAETEDDELSFIKNQKKYFPARRCSNIKQKKVKEQNYFKETFSPNSFKPQALGYQKQIFKLYFYSSRRNIVAPRSAHPAKRNVNNVSNDNMSKNRDDSYQFRNLVNFISNKAIQNKQNKKYIR